MPSRRLAAPAPEVIAKHRDRLLEFLDYDSIWLQTAAVCTLAKIATEPAHYKTVLPAIVNKSASFRVDSSSSRTSKAIADALKTASPEVKAFADPLLKKTYGAMPSVLAEPNTGAVMSGGAKVVRTRIGTILRQLPGGEEFVREIPKTTLASYKSGKDSDMYTYNGKFTPNPAVVGTWAWAVWPQPTNPSEIDNCIANYLKGKKGKDPTQVEKPKDMLQLHRRRQGREIEILRRLFLVRRHAHRRQRRPGAQDGGQEGRRGRFPHRGKGRLQRHPRPPKRRPPPRFPRTGIADTTCM